MLPSKSSAEIVLLSMFLIMISGCFLKEELPYEKSTHIAYTTFKEDLDFLKSHTEIILLREPESGSYVAVSPLLQGRVMTSSSDGFDGRSYGWINNTHFDRKEILENFNPYGGEERFWLGPEAGQFGLFFNPGSAFTLDNWQTPALIDREPFEIEKSERNKVVFTKRGLVSNYNGFTFNVGIERQIEILTEAQISTALGIQLAPDIQSVGYQSTNILTNTGSTEWTKESGLLSIWLLGMFPSSPQTTVIIPYIEGNEAQLGEIVNTDYFETIPKDRLLRKNGVVLFKADSQLRSKIGLHPNRAIFVLGAYDADTQVLTIVKYDKPTGKPSYVNSEWNIQENPYNGDVINAYNDGPSGEGLAQLGSFYELETSSPALELGPSESVTHTQYTFHFEGSIESLNLLSENILSISLDSVLIAF